MCYAKIFFMSSDIFEINFRGIVEVFEEIIDIFFYCLNLRIDIVFYINSFNHSFNDPISFSTTLKSSSILPVLIKLAFSFLLKVGLI